ncbi:MAG: DNA alkylation repair protein [Dehalococcoidia bacterium]|nr:DNA alkylation repair protein [Dehalococcoidia bacterium]
MTSAFAGELVRRLEVLVRERACASRAAGNAKYMRNLFPFAGVSSPELTLVLREGLAGLPKPSEADVLEAAEQLWTLPEREFQYLGASLLGRHARLLGPGALPRVRALIETKSWWDTVDTLASRVVGTLVRAHPELREEMDRWAGDRNTWIARTAVLHQLRYRGSTDEARLFGYCLQRAAEPEFFIRKAIGWALREYSKTTPEAVRVFIAQHDAELSPLSKREGMLWLTGRPGSKRRAEVEAAARAGQP